MLTSRLQRRGWFWSKRIYNRHVVGTDFCVSRLSHVRMEVWGNQPIWFWIKSAREYQSHRGLRGKNRVQMYYRWNARSLCLCLHSALDAAVGVWYIRPSLAASAAGCVCFPKLPGCECINVIHWQHERQRNYSWRCRPACYNSGICQLSVLFISHLSLKLFVGLSVNGGSLPVESAVLKCRLLQADALSNNPE